MKFSHRMTGHDELRRKLRSLPAAVQREVSVEALKHAAEPMREEAALLAPRSKGHGPHMADHIVVEETQFGGAIGPDVSTVALGPTKDFWYASFQEFGTAHNPAHPFMRPAFDSRKGVVKARLAESVRAAMRKIVGS